MSRKYKQRGYQESDGQPSRGRAGGPGQQLDGPRGRGLGAPTESSFKCARCGATVAVAIDDDSTCPSCRSDLHTCTNCRHFDSSVHNECREAVAERIAAKAQSNACAQFAPKIVQGFAADSKAKPDDPKAAFDALFDL